MSTWITYLYSTLALSHFPFFFDVVCTQVHCLPINNNYENNDFRKIVKILPLMLKQCRSIFLPSLTSVLLSLLVPPSILPSIDPSVIGTCVTMAPVCTTLTEPRVQFTVQPSLHDIFISTSTTDEKLHFGYICEGSTFVAKNISGNVSVTLHV